MNSHTRIESRRSALLAIGAGCWSGMTSLSVLAQTKAAPLPVAEIVQRNIAARGGAGAWRAVRTLSMSGLMDAGRRSPDASKLVEETRSAPGKPRKRLHPELTKAEAQAATVIRLPYLIEFRRPHQMRVELKVKDATAVQVYDGTAGWKVRPFVGRREVEPYSAYELKLAANQQEFEGPLIDYAAKGTKVESAGSDVVDGRETYKLKLTLKTGNVMDMWIDAQTFLDVKLSIPRAIGGKQHSVVTFMRDFRKVDGLMLPFQLEDQILGNPTIQRIDIQQVAVNPTLADSRFAKPV
jgi:outer membrane lipoprotein-sorting protein